MSIIDCHVHLNHYNSIQKIKTISSLKERITKLLKVMDNNNVDYSIILTSYKFDNERPSTSQVIDMVEKNYEYKSKLGIVAGFTIENHKNEYFKKCIKWLKDELIKGIKLYCGYEHYYPYDKRYQKIYDICIEYKVPVMIHTGDTFSNLAKVRFAHPLHIDEIAVDNPELTIIMCHLGNPWILDCQEILYKNKNVYADISGLVVGDFTLPIQRYYIKKVKELLNYVPMPHHLIYGSDWPISTMHSYLDFINKLKLNKQERDLLLFKNSQNLFRL
jgi:predicted TIM-barrel fold metal-dependent hydrolase